MRIRFIFVMSLFLAGFLATFSIIPTPAQAECNFTSGAFNNCSDSFSSPAILPNAVSITNNSNMEILSAILNNNVAIDVASNSKLTFGVSSGNGSLIFNLNDANSSINYRGGASGSVDVNLNAVCGGSDCFRTSGNIRNLNFQSGSQFTVGAVEYRGDEESANVTINNVVGNGSIRLTNGSVLTITNYAYDDSNPANAIQSISGGNEFYSNASKIFINELDVPHPIFNGYVNVLNIIKAEDVVFNTAADIGVINNSKNIRFNSSGAKINAGTIENSGVLTIYNSLVSIDNISNTDEIDVKYSTANITNLDQVHIVKVQDGPSGGSIVGSTVKIDNLGYLEEADIDSNSTLNIAGGSNAHLDAVYGDGTLHVEDGSIHIHNINLNNLVFDGGDITLEKDFQDAPHVINNITRTDSSFAGGNLTQTQGTLIIRNIDWLNSLTIQGGDLALSSVNHIGSLNMNSGNLYLVVGHDNNVAYDNNSVIHVDNATFGGGVTTTMVRSTAELKLNVPNQFLLIDSDNGFLATRAVNQDLFYVTLDPARWDVSVIPNPNNPNQLLLRVERICTLYEEIAGECGGVDVIDPPEPPRPPVKDLAKYLDRLIAQGIPLDILDKLEVYSTTPRELYNNLSSLIPLSGDTYLKSAHYGLSTALSVSKSNALSEDKDLWAMYYYSNGRYKDDNESPRALHKYNSVQFGYNLHDSATDEKKYTQTGGLIGGFSIGDMNNFNYRSDVLSFNVGGMYRYQIENNIINISMMYGLSKFDTTRDYFISTNPIPPALVMEDVDTSRLKSNLTTYEFLLDMQYGYKLTFDSLQGVALTPRVFLTPAMLHIAEYTENGPYSAMEIKTQNAPIVESGVGFDLSKGFNIQGGSLDFSVGSDAFYRYYRIPVRKIAFAGTPFGTTLGEAHTYDGLVLNPKFATNYTYKKSQFGVFYQREQSRNYFENTVGASYKYSF